MRRIQLTILFCYPSCYHSLSRWFYVLSLFSRPNTAECLKKANDWPFIKTFKKTIHRNTIFLMLRWLFEGHHFYHMESWTGRPLPKCWLGPQESVYHYFGGPNKLFATWFQLEEPLKILEIFWLLKYYLQKGKHKGPIDFVEFFVEIVQSAMKCWGDWEILRFVLWRGHQVIKLPFYKKQSGEILENFSSPNLCSQGHGSLGRASQTSSWRCWYCQPEPLKWLCFHAFSTWNKNRICEKLPVRQIDTICFYICFYN